MKLAVIILLVGITTDAFAVSNIELIDAFAGAVNQTYEAIILNDTTYSEFDNKRTTAHKKLIEYRNENNINWASHNALFEALWHCSMSLLTVDIQAWAVRRGIASDPQKAKNHLTVANQFFVSANNAVPATPTSIRRRK